MSKAINTLFLLVVVVLLGLGLLGRGPVAEWLQTWPTAAQAPAVIFIVATPAAPAPAPAATVEPAIVMDLAPAPAGSQTTIDHGDGSQTTITAGGAEVIGIFGLKTPTPTPGYYGPYAAGVTPTPAPCGLWRDCGVQP